MYHLKHSAGSNPVMPTRSFERFILWCDEIISRKHILVAKVEILDGGMPSI